jgi:hypothetical protein
MRLVTSCGLLVFFSLTACAHPIVTACPPVPAYSDAFQARLAEEVHALPPDSALGRAIVDYGRLRAQLRACAGQG